MEVGAVLASTGSTTAAIEAVRGREPLVPGERCVWLPLAWKATGPFRPMAAVLVLAVRITEVRGNFVLRHSNKLGNLEPGGT